LRKKLLNSIKYIVFLLLGIALLFLAFKGVDLESLWVDLKQADYRWVGLALILSFLSHLGRAVRWKILIETLGYKPKTSNTFYAVMIGYFANLAAPRLGEITRCGSLHKTDKIPFDSLIGTVIVERAIDMLMLIIIMIIVFFAKINFFGSFLTEHVFTPLGNKFSELFTSTGSVLLYLFIGVAIIGLIWFFLKKFSHLDTIQKIRKILSGVLDGLKSVYKMQHFTSFIFYTIFIWFMYFLLTWVMFFSIPETAHLKPIDGLFMLAIGSLGMVAPVQGGMGAFHWIVSLGLTIYGIPREKGLVYATISHESQTLFIIILGAISLLIIMLKQKNSYLVAEK